VAVGEAPSQNTATILVQAQPRSTGLAGALTRGFREHSTAMRRIYRFDRGDGAPLMRAQRLLRDVDRRTQVRRTVPARAAEVTRVGPDLVIRGIVEGRGQIEVQGKVEGQVKCREVSVVEGGRIEGSVVAELVQIGGAVEGPVRATTVEITKTARVVGNITHLNLSVEAGAYLEGRRPWRPRPLGDEDEQFTFAETD